MSKTIVDACALINIVNSAIPETILADPARTFYVQGIVLYECRNQSFEIRRLIETGVIREIDGSSVSVGAVNVCARQYGIGIGEAECIILAKLNGLDILIDDQKGKRSASRELCGSATDARVFGTIKHICNCIDAKIISDGDAARILGSMIAAGGYLPQFDFKRRLVIS